MTTTCPTCGAVTTDEARACPTCGTQLHGGPASTPPSAPPPSSASAGSPPPTSPQGFSPVPTMPPPPAAAHPSGLTNEVRNWGMAAHLSAYLGLFGGIMWFVGPLVVWLAKRDEHPFIEYHAKEALNFNITWTLYTIVAGVSVLVLVGIVLLPVVLVAWFVLPLIAGIKASNGESYRYPMTIRFVS